MLFLRNLGNDLLRRNSNTGLYNAIIVLSNQKSYRGI
jgi:hypothetical protein